MLAELFITEQQRPWEKIINKCRTTNVKFCVSVPLCYFLFCVFAWLARVSFIPSSLIVPRVVPCRVYFREYSRSCERTFQAQQPMDHCSWRVQQFALMVKFSLHTGVHVAECGWWEACRIQTHGYSIQGMGEERLQGPEFKPMVTVYRGWRCKTVHRKKCWLLKVASICSEKSPSLVLSNPDGPDPAPSSSGPYKCTGTLWTVCTP